jgi:hypothetical protein
MGGTQFEATESFFRRLMPELEWDSKKGTAELNGYRIIGYPSK